MQARSMSSGEVAKMVFNGWRRQGIVEKVAMGDFEDGDVGNEGQ